METATWPIRFVHDYAKSLSAVLVVRYPLHRHRLDSDDIDLLKSFAKQCKFSAYIAARASLLNHGSNVCYSGRCPEAGKHVILALAPSTWDRDHRSEDMGFESFGS